MALIGSRTLQRETKRILDQVEDQGEPVVILRHGRPAAALVPIDQEQAEAIVLATSSELKERRAARRRSGESRQRPFAVSEVEFEPQPDEEPGGSPEAVPDEEQIETLGVPGAIFSTQQLSADVGLAGTDSSGVEDASVLIAAHRHSLRVLSEFAERLTRQTAAIEARLGRRAEVGGEETPAAALAEEAEKAT